jgi:exosortase/archaeosortase family protein
MNSLFSLSAIGLVYLHLRRAPPWWYTAMMVAPIVLFAIGGNFARIVLLILLTHYFGDAVAQSFLHESAGVVAFLVALLGVAAVDAALAPILMTRKLKAS